MTNSYGGGSVAGVAAREILARAWEAKTGAVFAEPEPPEEIELPPEKLESFAGLCASELGLTWIVRAGASLEARLSGRTLNLVPCADGSFKTEYRVQCSAYRFRRLP